MSASLRWQFAALEDPRVERNQRQAVLDIVLDMVLLTVCAVVRGVPGWEAIQEFGHAKRDGLRKFGRCGKGVPSQYYCCGYTFWVTSGAVFAHQ